VSNICKTILVERTIVFIDTEIKETVFTVHSSNVIINENSTAQMFPHLFSFGRGHPNEPKRRIKLSLFSALNTTYYFLRVGLF